MMGEGGFTGFKPGDVTETLNDQIDFEVNGLIHHNCPRRRTYGLFQGEQWTVTEVWYGQNGSYTRWVMPEKGDHRNV